MNPLHHLGMAALGLLAFTMPAVAQTGDITRGDRVFRVCAACHSLEPNRNMTGPSLAELWNRKAGGLLSFARYSEALKSSGITWTDATLDEWLKDPQHFIPGNTMTFPGVKDARQRTDLLAYLKDVTQSDRTPSMAQRDNQTGMMGMMAAHPFPNLKKLSPDERVATISHCGDTYRVTTADGKTRAFWERNLRFKTDVSEDGPQKGAPAIVRAGMMGDRADIIFAAPEEMSTNIMHQC